MPDRPGHDPAHDPADYRDDYRDDARNAPPLNPLPPIVWLLALPMIGLEAMLSLGASGWIGGPTAVGWRLEAVQKLAFSPDLMRFLLATRQVTGEGLLRLVSYGFVHGNVSHALWVVVILLALGKYVGEVFRWWAVLAVFLVSSVAGALAYTVIPDIHAPLIGAYPADFGLIGAFSFMLWVRQVGTGLNRLRAFRMIGFLMFFQLVYGWLFGGGWDWVANLAGFAAGFALSFVVSPGGWGRVRAQIRQR